MTTVRTPVSVREHGNAYNIFILVLTLMSLAIMVLLILPLDEDTLDLLRVYDNLICFVFLADFAVNLRASRPRSYYLVTQRGWLDLLGSIPAIGGGFRLTALLRLARLSRLARIRRLLAGNGKKELIADVLRNRGQYATFITLLLVLLVLSISSVMMVQLEHTSADANIKTGGDALWWSMVTITTVGYGDRYPVTELGRLLAILVMFSGIGIIGALASILASLLVSPSSDKKEGPDAAGESPSPSTSPVSALSTTPGLEAELSAMRTELASLRVAVTALAPPTGVIEEQPEDATAPAPG